MSRRKSRKLAFQALFQVDQVEADPNEALAWLLQQSKAEGDGINYAAMDESGVAFAKAIVNGVMAHQEEIDALISQFSRSWKLERMFSVDRVILRIGSYEILYGNVPPAIAIDEAIEITKAYGDEHSPAFVNAILDQVKTYHEQQTIQS